MNTEEKMLVEIGRKALRVYALHKCYFTNLRKLQYSIKADILQKELDDWEREEVEESERKNKKVAI